MIHKGLALGLVTALCAGALSACTKAQARTPGPAPVPVSLEMPEPPPRTPIPVAVNPPPEPPPQASTDRPAQGAVTRPRPPQSQVNAPPPTVEPPPPVMLPGAQAEFQARAKERLADAERDLGRVQRSSLGSREARDQFDTAERFIRMARDAMAARNFVFAASCADKAATLAELLVKML